MANAFGWRAAFRIAARDARASRAKFLFVILAVAAGVGALTGVRGFSNSFRAMLLREARTFMAADLSVRSFEAPSPEQVALMDGFERRGVRKTWVTETVSMMSSARAAAPVLVSLKAVDPKRYPFYGAVRLDPPAPLDSALSEKTVAVSEDLLIRLDASVGDTVRLGEQEFRIAAVVRLEPDRMTGSLNVGPRVLMTRSGLDRAELLRTGSRASQRFLFRLPAEGVGVEELRDDLKRAFPHALVADFRETHPLITRGLNRSTRFLSLVSLIALIVGSLGVAMAMYAHLQQRLDTIAIMKCLGGQSSQILRIYLAQALALGVAGSVLGIVMGSMVQAAFPALIQKYFALRPDRFWDPLSALEGLGVGVVSAVLFSLPPLLGIRKVRPGLIFRRDMAETKPRWRERWNHSRGVAAAAGAILAGIGLIAAWFAEGDLFESARVSGYFVGSLAASFLALSAVAWVLLRSLRLLVRRARSLPASLRHGISNLYRPGNHAEAVLVALGVGVMFTATIYLLQHSLLAQITASAPPGMPNVFLINITEREREGVLELLRNRPGVAGTPKLVASVSARLETVNGIPIAQLDLQDWNRRLTRSRSVTWRGDKPEQTEVLEGSWWSGDVQTPAVCVQEGPARALGLRPGSRLQWTSAGQPLAASVACIFRSEAVEPGSDMEFVFSPGALDHLPTLYFAGVRMQPDRVATLQKEAFRRFPSVTVINAADVLAIVQDVLDQIALVVRFVSGFAILAGVIILASSVAGTRFRRVREVVILKTLGATRRRVAGIFSAEFLILGAVAGLMGSILASGFSNLLLSQFLEAPTRIEVLPALLATLLTALLANLTGWLTSYRILREKPLEALRDE